MDTQSETAAQFPSSVAHTKRFMERWLADGGFRQDCLTLPMTPPLQADPARLRPLYDPAPAAVAESPSEEVTAYRNFMQWRALRRQQVVELGTPSEPRFAAWRERQRRRVLWELGAARTELLVHAPACFELSLGCTVKCWFCGVGAEPFGGNLAYDQAGAALWRGVLQALGEVCGPALAQASCYWATDPLDNPDYEKFLLDFHALLGQWPPTSTAIALRDVERTRALLQLSREKGGRVDRFSVLSRTQFERILAEFSPEELLHVELFPQFNEQVAPKIVSGGSRVRALRLYKEKGTPLPADLEDAGSIACITGFLVNLVERSVQLISPCSANAKWPLGFIRFAQFRFQDLTELKARLDQALDAHMPLTVSLTMPVRFHPFFQVEYTDRGFALRSRYYVLGFDQFTFGAELGRRIASGTCSAGELAEARYHEHGIDPVQTLCDLNLLFNQGVLSEEFST